MNISKSTVMHWNVNTYNKSEKVKDKYTPAASIQ